MINVFVDKNKYSFEKGSSLEKIIKKIAPDDKNIIVAAIVDNKIRELNYKIKEDFK